MSISSSTIRWFLPPLPPLPSLPSLIHLLQDHSCGVRLLMAVEHIIATDRKPKATSWTDSDVEDSRDRFRSIIQAARQGLTFTYIPPGFVKDEQGYLTQPPQTPAPTATAAAAPLPPSSLNPSINPLSE